MPLPSDSIASRARAAKLLDLPAEATPAEARSAFLERLQRVDFAPTDDLRAGLGLLDERLAAASFAATAVENVCRDMLSADVDEFSHDFWMLPPTERKVRWQALWERCAKQPALLKHLRHLELGLDVTGNESSSLMNRSARIAELIKQTFPLRRLERTVRRQEWLAEISSQPEMWKQAANQMSSSAPALAALDPNLIDCLRKRVDRVPALTRTTGTAASAAPFIFTERTRSKNRNSETKNIGWAVYLVMILAIGLLRSAFSPNSNRNSDPSPPPYRNQYQDRSPSYTPFPSDESNARLQELLDNAHRNVPPPPKKKAELLPSPKSTPAPGDRP